MIGGTLLGQSRARKQQQRKQQARSGQRDLREEANS